MSPRRARSPPTPFPRPPAAVFAAPSTFDKFDTDTLFFVFFPLLRFFLKYFFYLSVLFFFHFIFFSQQSRDPRVLFLLPLGEKGSSGRERLEMSAGLTLIDGDEGAIIVDMVGFLSPAEKAGIDFDWQVKGVDINANRLPKELAYIPAFMLLGLIALLHRRRLRQNR